MKRKCIDRIRSQYNNGYPLREPLFVVFGLHDGLTTSQFYGEGPSLSITGYGIGYEYSLLDLEKQFDHLVVNKVRIPPHTYEELDNEIRSVINKIVDWKKFELENPMAITLWGQILKESQLGGLAIFWLQGPNGISGVSLISNNFNHSNFELFLDGVWFRAVVKEYPDRVEWIEPPYIVPNPFDWERMYESWNSIPFVYADKENVWPKKEDK